MIKRYEITPVMECKINKNIQGLRKKAHPFSKKPSTHRYYLPFGTWERNAHLNVGLSRNWVRLSFPLMPMFFFSYVWMPVIYGWIYESQYNNF